MHFKRSEKETNSLCVLPGHALKADQTRFVALFALLLLAGAFHTLIVSMGHFYSYGRFRLFVGGAILPAVRRDTQVPGRLAIN